MKKILSALFCLLLGVLLTVGFASCGKDVEFNVNFIVDGETYATIGTSGEETIKIPENPTKEGYTFDGWYWDNDVWEKPFTANSLLDTPLSSDMSVYAKWSEAVHTHTEVLDAAVAPTDTTDGLTEGKHCSECGEVLIKQEVVPALLQGTAIKSQKLEVNGETITTSLSNTTETFSFLNDLTVANGASYVVARDIGCEQTIASKTVTLEIGNNTYYVLVTNGNAQKLYTVTVRRRPMYTVSFAAGGGTAVSSQTVEEGSLATEPTTTRAGYTFAGWNYDFTTPIMTNTRIIASWTANTDTPYKVEYYLQNIDDDGYTRLDSETENLTGTTGTRVTAEQKTFEHFTLNTSESTLNGYINNTGTLVLKIYYTRNEYTISNANTNYGSITIADSYKYESPCVASTATANIGCEFLGWYSGEEFLSTNTTYTFTAEKNVEAKFIVKSEMANFNFTSTATTCTITSLKDKTITEIVVPNYATSIGEYAFRYCSELTSITIPNGVTSIGEHAFYYCSELTSITIPDSVTSIGEGAFQGCNSLTSIVLPFVGATRTAGGYKAHFGYVFGYYSTSSDEFSSGPYHYYYWDDSEYPYLYRYYTYKIPGNLKSVTITDSSSIGKGTFRNCSNLTSISISANVTYIGEGAFQGCSSLISVTLPFIGATLNGTDNTHFGYIFGASDYYFNDNYVPTSLKTVVITGGASVGNSAFEYCRGLTSITIPNGVTSIGDSAFRGCSGLTSITIPNSVMSIGSYAFYDCYKLIEVYNLSSLNITAASSNHGYVAYYAKNVYTATIRESKMFTDENGYLFYDDGTNRYLIGYTGSDTILTLPASCKGNNYEIYTRAFYGRDDITSVTIPNSVESLGSYAFAYCINLSELTIGNSVRDIGASAFYKCSGLESITVASGNTKYHSVGNCLIETASKKLLLGCQNSVIPADGSVTSICNYAFQDCSELTSITIPNSVTKIGFSAFSGCSGLESITLPFVGATLNGTDNTHFGYIFGASSYSYNDDYVPASLKIVVITGGTSIGFSAFSGCSGLESITLPFVGATLNGTDNTHFGYIFGANSYSYNDDYVPASLKTVIITGGTFIGEDAFEYCSGLKSVTIPNSVTSIGNRAFLGCSGLTSITIPNGVTSIGNWAFSDCSRLTSINYRGTSAQWNAITKGSYWNTNTGNYTITYNYTGE